MKQLMTNNLSIVVSSTLKISSKENILIIDPCYLFNGDILDGVWQDFVTLMFKPENEKKGLGVSGIMSYNGATMLYGGTAYGDGCYSVKSNIKDQQGSECGVDAGMLCFISVKDVLKINPKFKDWNNGVIFPNFSGTLETDGEGLFEGSMGIKCDTKGEEEQQPTCDNCGSDIDYEGATCDHCENVLNADEEE